LAIFILPLQDIHLDSLFAEIFDLNLKDIWRFSSCLCGISIAIGGFHVFSSIPRNTENFGQFFTFSGLSFPTVVTALRRPLKISLFQNFPFPQT
jgi:hypothetical protein